MLENYSEFRSVIIFSVILLMIGSASATGEPVVNVEEADKVIWLNDGVDDKVLNLEASCRDSNMTEPVDHLYIWDGNSEQPITSQNSEDVKYSIDIGSLNDYAQPGKYQVFAECEQPSGGMAQSHTSFEMDKFSVDMDDPPENLFLGEDFQVEVEVDSAEGNLDVSSDIDSPIIELRSEKSDFKPFNDGDNPRSRSMTIDADRIPVEFIEQDNDKESGVLKASITYNELTSDERRSYFTVSDELEVNINRWNIQTVFSPSKRISYRDLSDMNVSIDLMYEGEAVAPETPEDTDYAGRFYIDDDGDKIDPEKGEDDSYEWFSGGYQGTSNGFGKYELSLEKTPKLDVGTHDLGLYYETSDGRERLIGNFTVENKFTLEGRVSDSDSRAVQTDFTLDSGSYVEKFSTNMNGEFSRRVLPSTRDREYDLSVQFPKGDVNFMKTQLRQNITGNINYDYFKNPGGMDLDLGGIKPINLMTVSFGYPFDQARAEMEYNPAKAENPMEVQVFECVEWNFWSKECISGWDKIDDDDVTLPPTEWTAKFPVTPVKTSEYGGEQKSVMLSAYLVGTNSELSVSQISVDNFRAPVGSSNKFSGKVESDVGSVSDAEVDFSLMKDDEFIRNASTTTDSDGGFTTSLDMPDEGNYTMFVAAEKDPYEPYSEKIDDEVWVYRESAISMDLPQSVDLYLDQNNTVEAELVNEGQTTYKNIEVSVEGPEGGDYGVSGLNVRELAEGGTEDFELRFGMPRDFCDPSCVEYPEFDIILNAETEGKDVERTFELNSIIQNPSSQQGSSSETSEQSDDEDDTENSATGMFTDVELEGPTADFIQSQSALNIALGLIMVFTMALAGAIKKKKNGSSSGRGGRNLSGGSRGGGRQVNIQRPKVSPSEDPEVMSPDDDIDEIAEAMTEKDQKAVVEEDVDVDEVEISHEEPKVETADEIAEEKSDAEEVEESDTEFKCDTCGEKFDTESGLKLHREALH